MPCVSANLDIIPDPDDRRTPPDPNPFVPPRDLDDLELCSVRTIENYLNMDHNCQQITANIKEWRHICPEYENFPSLLESEHRQRWGSHFILDSEYVTPDSIHNLVVDTHDSDPDESQC